MKRIILCADGTWKEPERRDKKTGRPQPTNVLKIARALLPRSKDGVEQVIYYHEGVGTNGSLDRVTGGAFGAGMEHNVRALYRFLVYNYEPGDQLYCFGFSRGSFTVRTFAGFMHKVGLLQKSDEYFTPELYKLYESSQEKDSPAWLHAFRHIKDRRPSPQIRFIGGFDTVGSLGAPGLIGQFLSGNRYKYHDIGLNPTIENAYHALAIDERRKPFKPSLWTRPPGWDGVLEQVWFPGVHSNVGGSRSPDGLANEALHWMVEKAEVHKLEFDTCYLEHYRPCFNSVLNESMTFFYKLMGPYTRRIGGRSADGEAVHQSAVDRTALAACQYDPENLRNYLASGSPSITTTQRIPRGTPCA